MKHWRFLNQPSDSASQAPCPSAWAEQLGVPQIIASLLWQRGIHALTEMDEFLSPGLRHLATPDAWPGMEKAAVLLAESIQAGKQVLVWGDYDVDGITGSTLMLEVLRFHGVPVSVHLPDRRTEGYGLNIPVLEHLATERDPENCVLLTVDCGISDVAAVARARALGFTVIVSDHHMPPAVLPDAEAITNPRLSDDNPCPHLAGVGVAFFLMARVNALLAPWSGTKLDVRKVLDLVALGTLADLVPLNGQNRVLVKNGLLKIAEARRPGLAALKDASGFSPVAVLGSGQVVFNLAPRINAAGRLGTPLLAHEMLKTDDHEIAGRLARQLTALNDERRAEEERIHTEALEQAASFMDQHGLVLCGADWHQGVIGIVASRIVEACYRPVLILCEDNGVLKGSGRSIPEFDLYAGLSACADLLLGFGGHKQAAGLRVKPENLPALRERFDRVIRDTLGENLLTPTIKIDCELPFSLASDFTVLKSLELLQPFGMGNPEPVFASLPLLVRKRRLFGRGKEHVTLEVTEKASGITLQAKAWRMADAIPEDLVGQTILLAYTPGINAYNGIASVELRLKDWKPA